MAASSLLVAGFLFALLALVFAPLVVWVERKQGALMQDRVGANRADLLGLRAIGLFQPLADAIKLFTKEDFVPQGGDRVLHGLAPFIAVVPAFTAFAVIPFGGSYSAWGQSVSLVVADLDYGILFVFAIGSVAAYGPLLAGWASNSSWGLLGSLRAAAQTISCEVALGVSVFGVFMIFGSLRLTEIGLAQQELFRPLGFLEHFGLVAAENVWVDLVWLPMWGILLQPLAFFTFLAALLAAHKRAPFDLPEGGGEIVAGYVTEYSGVRSGLFGLGEFVGVVVIAGLMTSLFLGGWALPLVSDATLIAGLTQLFGPNLANVVAMLLHVGVFFSKVCALIFLQVLIRWSLPRFRYDQVMRLGWKVLLPLSLANLLVTGLALLIVRDLTS